MGPSFHECLMLLHLAQKSVSLYYDHSEQFMLTVLMIICHYLFSPLWISTSHPTESLLFPNCYLFMHTFQLQPAGVKIVLFRARSPPALAGGGGVVVVWRYVTGATPDSAKTQTVTASRHRRKFQYHIWLRTRTPPPPLEIQTNLREVWSWIIAEKAPTRAFSWLKED